MINMMNSDHKSMNDKARKGFINTFTFIKENKIEIDNYFEKNKNLENYIYSSVDILESLFGYNVRVVLKYIKHPQGEEIQAFIQRKYISEIESEKESNKLLTLTKIKSDFNNLQWRLDFSV